ITQYEIDNLKSIAAILEKQDMQPIIYPILKIAETPTGMSGHAFFRPPVYGACSMVTSGPLKTPRDWSNAIRLTRTLISAKINLVFLILDSPNYFDYLYR